MYLNENQKKEIGKILDDFKKEVVWTGVFFDSPELEALATHDKTPAQGLHMTTWYKNTKLTPENFVSLVAGRNVFKNAFVIGYADNGVNQGVQITPIADKTDGITDFGSHERTTDCYFGALVRHISISWASFSSPVKTGNLKFENFYDTDLAKKIPSKLEHGKTLAVTFDGQKKSLDEYAQRIEKVLDKERIYAVVANYRYVTDFAESVPCQRTLFITPELKVAQQAKEKMDDQLIRTGSPFNNYDYCKITIEPMSMMLEKDVQNLNGKDFGFSKENLVPYNQCPYHESFSHNLEDEILDK